MTSQRNSTVHPVSSVIRMLQGAGLALMLISALLILAGEGNPDWPELWQVKPLLIVPLAGAVGGLFYYTMDHLRYQGGLIKVLGIIFSILGYLIVLWLGTVLGLNGTMWN